jgi:transcriptional enhancer factor
MDKVGGPVSDISPAWQGRSIAGPKLRLVEFSAYLEQNVEPESVSFVLP